MMLMMIVYRLAILKVRYSESLLCKYAPQC